MFTVNSGCLWTDYDALTANLMHKTHRRCAFTKLCA